MNIHTAMTNETQDAVSNVETEYLQINSTETWPIIYQVSEILTVGTRKKIKETYNIKHNDELNE